MKYFGYKSDAKLSDEDDVWKEMRVLYIRLNVLIHTFSKCSEKVFRMILYIFLLVEDRSTRFAYINVFKKVSKLPPPHDKVPVTF